MASTDVIERFWAKVDKTSPSGCWEWTAARQPNGYGRFGWAKGDIRMAHRVAYELTKGPIPAGLVIDHLCRNHGCVRPDHLEPVTQRENILRGIRRQPDTHCKRGHEFTPENTYMRPNGRQACRPCHRAYDRDRKRALRAQRKAAA
ncbi:HNH endonuclease signature motif containing protein [Pimelobacter simplex]|uniref:HNH endonuclease signature motif containing protein n=1 Tax=Nocardioides simplex TaxID=2045 RepID=UPI00215069C7|nr:HNH endonuclease signature motif containing protein [Pimelobacter simplex]UUW87397.1 HNH endonuclease [Pimelobacter simplex]UUW96902.1 HNH endonuclease [Pimelobacter simplex]